MSEFRLTQISDAHLARRLPGLAGNFHRVCDYIDANRPDLVVNSGDLAFDGPTNPDDLEFATGCPARFRCRVDICPAITTSAITRPMPVHPRRTRLRNRIAGIFLRFTEKIAGASRPPGGVSSG